jgi:hypothetical protein
MYQTIPDGGRTETDVNPYRELAEAIRAGCKTTKKTKGCYFWMGTQTCALGAAMFSLNLLTQRKLFARFPILRQKIAGQRLSRRIIYMNDCLDVGRRSLTSLRRSPTKTTERGHRCRSQAIA